MNTVVQALTEEEKQQCFDLRLEVFVDEQGFSADIELDEYDATASHYLLKQNNGVVGVGRFILKENYGKIGRLAIKKSQRGKGLGKLLLLEIEKQNLERVKDFLLHAQSDKREFYENCGYVVEGDEFLEEGVPHLKMRKVYL